MPTNQVNPTKRPLWLELLLMILIPISGLALGVGASVLLGLNQTVYANVLVNLFFLFGVVVLVFVFKYTSKDLGLKILNSQMQMHVLLSLLVLSFYILFYIFAIRISALKPFSTSTLWGLITYLIVVIAEEAYFRGVLYSFFEKRFSAKAALIISSVLFGLFHAQQGLRGMILKMFTGWLWGSIRYSTGMIFLLIIPVHFAYNSIGLLYEGNWGNPPAWAIYAVPAIEFVLGMAIVLFNKRSTSKEQFPGKPQQEARMS